MEEAVCQDRGRERPEEQSPTPKISRTLLSKGSTQKPPEPSQEGCRGDWAEQGVGLGPQGPPSTLCVWLTASNQTPQTVPAVLH